MHIHWHIKCLIKKKQTNHAWLHQRQTQFHGCSTCFSKRHYIEISPKPQRSIFWRDSLNMWLYLIFSSINYSCGIKGDIDINAIQIIFVFFEWWNVKTGHNFQKSSKHSQNKFQSEQKIIFDDKLGAFCNILSDIRNNTKSFSKQNFLVKNYVNTTAAIDSCYEK